MTFKMKYNHMKLLFIPLILAFITSITFAQTNVPCDKWKISSIYTMAKPAFSDRNSVDNKGYKDADLLKSSQILTPSDVSNWQDYTCSNDSVLAGVNAPYQLVQLCGFVEGDRYTKHRLNIYSNGLFEVYLDGKKVKSQTFATDKTIKTDLTLTTGKHHIVVRLLSLQDNLKFVATLTPKDKESEANIAWTTDPKRGLNFSDIMNGEYFASPQISPSGKYLLLSVNETIKGSGKSTRATKIYDLEKRKNIFVVRNGASLGAKWLPKSDKIYYTVKKGNASDLYVYDIATSNETLLASEVENLGRVSWSPIEDFVIYSRSESGDKVGDLKRIFGNEDRLPYFRSRSFLYCLDVKTGLVKPLTAGFLSTYLQDIKPDGSKILISTSQRDYTEVPFSKQNLYEIDIQTLALDTIWTNKLYSGSCQYSPDGTKLLVQGSPETFGQLGVNVSEGRIPNSYDSQLYLYDIASQKVETLTKDFDPSISTVYWGAKDQVYFTATDKDCEQLYNLDLKKRAFTKIVVPVEVIGSIDFDSNASAAVFTGQSITTPNQLYSINLNNRKSTLIAQPKADLFKDIEFTTTEEWDFTNENGDNISGRVYYPKDYDPLKKYPLIVYYYGGTMPTTRTLGGRYPKNIWAANGYMVYVLQPSGAIGFGQDFSALHVNGWGRDAIDDIIDGTKKFLEAHPSADADNVGCIGASYGGYTTMMLQTRTDIFKTAIAHAGISDISSYWGEGYWGYSYSTGATKGSYPWNRKDIYVDNSPLFNADKFQNSILLIHGTADTNVPVGESLQFYAALKILDKDVEMILVDGEDHHIKEYHKLEKWYETIVAWFDKKLKNQPEEFEDMYPEKNL